MNEENNHQDDKPSVGQESTDENEIEYREISKEELDQILEDHEKWVESDGKEGIKADLRSYVKIRRLYIFIIVTKHFVYSK